MVLEFDKKLLIIKNHEERIVYHLRSIIILRYPVILPMNFGLKFLKALKDHNRFSKLKYIKWKLLKV